MKEKKRLFNSWVSLRVAKKLVTLFSSRGMGSFRVNFTKIFELKSINKRKRTLYMNPDRFNEKNRNGESYHFSVHKIN